MLNWSLVIATYNRPAALRRCVELAVAQTRPPTEVVIVDASADWATRRTALAAEVMANHPHVTLRYDGATTASLPAQRNQGIDAATADVLFLIDDDSFMYPDCAARVMDIYDADADGAVAGVSPALVGVDPNEVRPHDAAVREPEPDAAADEPATPAEPSAPPHKTMRQRLGAHVAGLMDIERLLQPYDAQYPAHAVPANLDLKKLNAEPARYLHGMRMTFRRDVIRRERFDEMLRGYAAAEDIDASYRASRHGLLLTALGALLYHAQDSAGRLTRFTRTAMGLVNLAALYHVKSHDPAGALRKLRRRVVQRTSLDLVRDLSRGRLTVPAARADLFALRKMKVLRKTPTDGVSQWLGAFQQDLLVRNPE